MRVKVVHPGVEMAEIKRLFRIQMTETHRHVFTIEAASQQDAHDKARALWPAMAEKVREQTHLIETSLLVEEQRGDRSEVALAERASQRVQH
jgi:hypothetical protein